MVENAVTVVLSFSIVAWYLGVENDPEPVVVFSLFGWTWIGLDIPKLFFSGYLVDAGIIGFVIIGLVLLGYLLLFGKKWLIFFFFWAGTTVHLMVDLLFRYI